MEKQTITIYDVAREAAVSMATVSRVVNGNPNVKPATRKKCLKLSIVWIIVQMRSLVSLASKRLPQSGSSSLM